jgi:DNA-binding response OmpR family regulator
VLEAADGRKGLELWRRQKMDLVILDVLMPVWTGPQVIEQIGKNRSGLVVLISAHTSEYDAVAASTVGADHFIAKPFEDIFLLVEKLEKMVKKE